MRIPSGVTDQFLYFVAVDGTDFTSRETGLSSFTVYRSRNGAAAAAMTTPTINETDSSNMPGVYELLLDEDMTIGSGNDSEEMVFHITHAGMAPVTRTIELYRPKITAGETLTVSSGVVSEVAAMSGTIQTLDALDTAQDTQHAATQTDIGNLNDPTAAAIRAEIDSNSTQLAAIVADTNELQGDWVNGGRLDLIVDAILADTNELQTDDIPGAISGLNNLSTSDIDARLAAIGLDHLLAASVTGTDVTDDSIVAMLVSASATADWDDFVNTTDSLQALRDHIGDGSNLTEAGGDGDHLTEAGGDGDHLTEAGGTGDQLTALATAAALTTVDGNVDSILADTNELQGDWANGGRLDLLIDAILADTNSLDGTKIPDTLSLANINAQVDGAFTTQMADSVPADGTIATREQALYMILQFLTDFGISGTTLTVRKVDGSTSLMTFTLDDGTNPTSLTRAS